MRVDLGPEAKNLKNHEKEQMEKILEENPHAGIIQPVNDGSDYDFYVERSDLSLKEGEEYFLPLDPIDSKIKNGKKFIKRPDFIKISVDGEVEIRPVDLKSHYLSSSQIAGQTSAYNLANLASGWDYLDQFLKRVEKSLPDKSITFANGFLMEDGKSEGSGRWSVGKETLDDYIKDYSNSLFGLDNIDFSDFWPKIGEGNIDSYNYMIEKSSQSEFKTDIRNAKNNLSKGIIPPYPIHVVFGLIWGRGDKQVSYTPEEGFKSFPAEIYKLVRDREEIKNADETFYARICANNERLEKWKRYVKAGRLERIDSAIRGKNFEKEKDYTSPKRKQRLNSEIGELQEKREEIDQDVERIYNQYFNEGEYHYSNFYNEGIKLKNFEISQIDEELQVKDTKLHDRQEREYKLNKHLSKLRSRKAGMVKEGMLPRVVYFNLFNDKQNPEVYKVTFYDKGCLK
ncbi:MAG: hypothetical protein ACQEP1_04380 [Nanobdellota archaeon]